MTDRSRFSMSDEAKLAAWNETLRRMKAAEQMVEDLRENVRTLVAERDAAEARAYAAEELLLLYGPVEMAQAELSKAGMDPDEVGRNGAAFVAQLQAQLAAPPGMQERIAERLGFEESADEQRLRALYVRVAKARPAVICTAGGGKAPTVEVSFTELEDAHAFLDMLVAMNPVYADDETRRVVEPTADSLCSCSRSTSPHEYLESACTFDGRKQR